MTAGMEVNRFTLDAKSVDAILALRNAFDKVENIAKWLTNTPSVDGVDPLVGDFGYSADDAYLIRITFEQLEAMRTANSSTFETARKLTGLE